MANNKEDMDDINESIDRLLEDGLIVCVGYNELGEELYATKEKAIEGGMKIYPSIEKKTKNDEGKH